MGRPKKKYHIKVRPNKNARNKWYEIWWREGEIQRFHDERYKRKADAEQQIDEWLVKERKIENHTNLKQFAKDFFTTPDQCPYLARLKNLKPGTVSGRRGNLERIIERFGDYRIDQISDLEFESWLSRLRRKPKKDGQKAQEMPLLSGSSQNTIIETYMIVMKAAKKARLIEHLPEIDRTARNSKRRDILFDEELKKLFPAEEVDLHERWSLSSDDKSGYMFGLMAKVQLQGGMRPGEVRALTPAQLFPEHNTVYIVHQLDSTDRIAPLKKSTSDDKRLRFVRIPAATMELLQRWVQSNEIGNDEFIFTFDGDFVKKDYYRRRFSKVLEKNGIESGDRWLTPYTLRYTFRSRMHGNMDLKTIMDMMGHRSEEVSENYLQINPEMFKVFEGYQEKIDRLW
jgi:integrase